MKSRSNICILLFPNMTSPKSIWVLFYRLGGAYDCSTCRPITLDTHINISKRMYVTLFVSLSNAIYPTNVMFYIGFLKNCFHFLFASVSRRVCRLTEKLFTHILCKTLIDLHCSLSYTTTTTTKQTKRKRSERTLYNTRIFSITLYMNFTRSQVRYVKAHRNSEHFFFFMPSPDHLQTTASTMMGEWGLSAARTLLHLYSPSSC